MAIDPQELVGATPSDMAWRDVTQSVFGFVAELDDNSSPDMLSRGARALHAIGNILEGHAELERLGFAPTTDDASPTAESLASVVDIRISHVNDADGPVEENDQHDNWLLRDTLTDVSGFTEDHNKGTAKVVVTFTGGEDDGASYARSWLGVNGDGLENGTDTAQDASNDRGSETDTDPKPGSEESEFLDDPEKFGLHLIEIGKNNKSPHQPFGKVLLNGVVVRAYTRHIASILETLERNPRVRLERAKFFEAGFGIGLTTENSKSNAFTTAQMEILGHPEFSRLGIVIHSKGAGRKLSYEPENLTESQAIFQRIRDARAATLVPAGETDIGFDEPSDDTEANGSVADEHDEELELGLAEEDPTVPETAETYSRPDEFTLTNWGMSIKYVRNEPRLFISDEPVDISKSEIVNREFMAILAAYFSRPRAGTILIPDLVKLVEPLYPDNPLVAASREDRVMGLIRIFLSELSKFDFETRQNITLHSINVAGVKTPSLSIKGTSTLSIDQAAEMLRNFGYEEEVVEDFLASKSLQYTYKDQV